MSKLAPNCPIKFAPFCATKFAPVPQNQTGRKLAENGVPTAQKLAPVPRNKNSKNLQECQFVSLPLFFHPIQGSRAEISSSPHVPNFAAFFIRICQICGVCLPQSNHNPRIVVFTMVSFVIWRCTKAGYNFMQPALNCGQNYAVFDPIDP